MKNSLAWVLRGNSPIKERFLCWHLNGSERYNRVTILVETVLIRDSVNVHGYEKNNTLICPGRGNADYVLLTVLMSNLRKSLFL